MPDTQSGPQDPASPGVDTEALFLKSLIAVFKDHRNVLARLPELMEQCLKTEPLNPDLAESRSKGESRDGDAERLAERKRSDLERKLESMEFDINVKTKRIKALDETIKDKTATLEAMKSEENAIILTKDRRSVERELKKKDKLLEESERKAKYLEEECLKLKKELEKKEKEISETGKVQEERISAIKNESENKVKEMSDKAQDLENQLLKEKDELQRMYGEYGKAISTHNSSYDAVLNELAAKDKEIQEYMESLSKMKEELRNAHAKVNLYKSRLASLSEKRVKQDQRLVEDTLSSNRQSELEKDFATFFDEERMDACDKMQSIYQNKEDTFVYIYYPRLACIIFEVIKPLLICC
ncbi:eukaryotic translation initiation factor 3 subunit A-like isoform X2 [Orbicella faveolata]|uniref:eukaryotic translation initiation factor 3 subunit A-like isoform X2 n=1 Tax=Orbicella faveolata TaxID=48498 RepID=UPI0009E5895D|nr:eukaryotic translation initiation factor 3 subunit A-like isoform X2 [Orbicella faveolata]